MKTAKALCEDIRPYLQQVVQTTCFSEIEPILRNCYEYLTAEYKPKQPAEDPTITTQMDIPFPKVPETVYEVHIYPMPKKDY